MVPRSHNAITMMNDDDDGARQALAVDASTVPLLLRERGTIISC